VKCKPTPMSSVVIALTFLSDAMVSVKVSDEMRFCLCHQQSLALLPSS
jgi:hypothetical protein